MDNYKITQYSVNSILGFVESSQIAIPEIQRPFVWKEKEVRDLIDSLYEGYPIGYLIVWQNSKVRLRGFGKGGTKKILIDGQQRVTALMAALMGKEVLDDQYRSHRIIISFNPLLFSFHSIRINDKGLTLIPSGCFSSLSSLSFLFIGCKGN